MNVAVFIGRFQPFHNGHQMIIDELVSNYGKILVIIGSCRQSRTRKNPFTYDERRQMIMSYTKDKVTILPARDVVECDKAWEREVVNLIELNTNEGDKITLCGCKKDNSSFYLDMFPEYDRCITPNKLYNIENGDFLSATFIRNEFFKYGCLNNGIMPKETFTFLREFIRNKKDYQQIRELYNAKV